MACTSTYRSALQTARPVQTRGPRKVGACLLFGLVSVLTCGPALAMGLFGGGGGGGACPPPPPPPRPSKFPPPDGVPKGAPPPGAEAPPPAAPAPAPAP